MVPDWITKVAELAGKEVTFAAQSHTIQIGWDAREDGDFSIHGFVFADIVSSLRWSARQDIIHADILKSAHSLKYTKLRPSAARYSQALTPTLEAANELNGVLVVVAVDKKVEAYSRQGLAKQKQSGQWDAINARWKNNQLHDALRFGSLLCSLSHSVVPSGSNLDIIVDEDGIFANRMLRDDVTLLLDYYFSKLGATHFGSRRIAFDKVVEPPYGTDFTGIPDLAVGALHEVLTDLLDQCALVADPWPFQVHWSSRPQKAFEITRWFFSDAASLKRVFILVKKEKSGMESIQRVFVTPRFHS